MRHCTAAAQTQTRHYLLALRSHMTIAVDGGVGIGAAVKRTETGLFGHLTHTNVWSSQLTSQRFLDIEWKSSSYFNSIFRNEYVRYSLFSYKLLRWGKAAQDQSRYGHSLRRLYSGLRLETGNA